MSAWDESGTLVSGVVLTAVVGLFLASGTQKEKSILSDARSETVRTLEAEAATRPADARLVARLASAYVESRAPGLAVARIEAAPERVRKSPAVLDQYARALVDQGRNREALAAEELALSQCSSALDSAARCDGGLIASATHRAEILAALVEGGVEDSVAEPEASRAAYYRSLRPARIAVR